MHYFAQVGEKTNRALDAERDALLKLRSATTDTGDRAKIDEQLRQIERTRTESAAESAQKRLELEKGLTKQIGDLEVQQLREQGPARSGAAPGADRPGSAISARGSCWRTAATRSRSSIA
jgi:hypothetical protein